MSTSAPAVPTVRSVSARWLGIALAVLVVAASVGSLVGVSIWIAVAVSGVAWGFYLRGRLGAELAVSLAVSGAFTLLLGTLMLTHVVSISILVGTVVVNAVVGLAGSALLMFGRAPVSLPRAGALVAWAGAFVGAVVWLGGLAIARFRPGAAHYSWVMLGDGANNLLFGRVIIAEHGIAVGANANPVPLPAGLLALSMRSARDGGASELLRADIGGFAQVWMLLIALTCVLCGLVAIRLVGRQRPIVAALTGAVASLLPMTWFVSGYPLEYGFFNADVILPLALVCCLAFLEVRRRPAAALLAFFFAATAMLATWGPLVLIPVSFGLVAVVRHFRALVAERGWMLVALIVGVVQVVAYGVGVTLPTLLTAGGALSSAGGAYPVSKSLSVAVAALTLILAVVRGTRVRDMGLTLVVTLGAALALGLAILLFSNRHASTLWGYYPLKFLWLSVVLLLVVGVGLLGSVIAEFILVRWLAIVALAASGALLVAGTGALNSVDGYDGRPPLKRIFDGAFFGSGDTSFDTLVALADRQPPNLLWRSGDPLEKGINFWLMQTRAGLADKNFDLRYAAYTYQGTDVNELCKIGGLMGPGLRVHTADNLVPVEVSRTCPEREMTFVTN